MHDFCWRDIESAPKDGTPVLAFWTGATEAATVYGRSYGITMFKRGEWVNVDNCDDTYSEPTHWMPLPAAPGAPPATTQPEPITVSLDPDPRGVSVGVWQGSHCIYTGAHAVPASVAPGDAQDGDSDIPELRSEAEIGFEDWLTRQMPKGSVISNPAWWAPRILRAAERLIRAEEQLAAAPAAGDAQDDETRWTLRWIMHQADAAKETCGTDPESPAAIRNAKLAAISAAAAQALSGDMAARYLRTIIEKHGRTAAAQVPQQGEA